MTFIIINSFLRAQCIQLHNPVLNHLISTCGNLGLGLINGGLLLDSKKKVGVEKKNNRMIEIDAAKREKNALLNVTVLMWTKPGPAQMKCEF